MLTVAFVWTLSAVLASSLTRDLRILVLCAAAVTGGAFLLLPLAGACRRWIPALGLAAGLAGCTTLIFPAWPWRWTTAAGTALGVALILYLIGALARLGARGSDGRVIATAWILFLSALLSGSPVWLGPLIDRLQPDTPAINALIAVNPLTHLAVLADLDWLRGSWLYRHSPLGSMRYEYPDPGWVIAGYLIAGLLATLAGSRRPPAGHPGRPVPVGGSDHTPQPETAPRV